MIFLDLLMAVLMFLFGLFFYKSKGKAANLLTVIIYVQMRKERIMMKWACANLME